MAPIQRIRRPRAGLAMVDYTDGRAGILRRRYCKVALAHQVSLDRREGERGAIIWVPFGSGWRRLK